MRSSRVRRTHCGQPYLEMRFADGVIDRIARKFQATAEQQRLTLDGVWITATGYVGSGCLPRDLVISSLKPVNGLEDSLPKDVSPGSVRSKQNDSRQMPKAACVVLVAEMIKVANVVRNSGLSPRKAEKLLQSELVEGAMRRALERMYNMGRDQ